MDSCDTCCPATADLSYKGKQVQAKMHARVNRARLAGLWACSFRADLLGCRPAIACWLQLHASGQVPPADRRQAAAAGRDAP